MLNHPKAKAFTEKLHRPVAEPARHRFEHAGQDALSGVRGNFAMVGGARDAPLLREMLKQNLSVKKRRGLGLRDAERAPCQALRHPRCGRRGVSKSSAETRVSPRRIAHSGERAEGHGERHLDLAVLRGVWMLDRIMGRPAPPPPPNVPAIEPDIRGAKTIREISRNIARRKTAQAAIRA